MLRTLGPLAAALVASAPISSPGAPGDVDMAFDPQVNSHPFGIGIQPDGKIDLVGWFSKIGGVPRAGLGRILGDGRLDTPFDPASDGQVFCTAIQPDGKILIAGSFSNIDNVYHGKIARLDANGNLDSGFRADADYGVYSISVQRDGKILVTGSFGHINGVECRTVARLNADGSLDTSFANPRINATVWTHTVQPDGRILIGGSFSTVAGTPQTRLARLNPDGSLDQSFPDPHMEGTVHGIVLQTGGRLVIGGSFTQVNGVTRNRMARLSSSGFLDNSFSPSLDDTLYTMMPQADGKLIITGSFTRVGSAVRIYTARLHADGSLDNSFVSNGKNAGLTVLSSALQADGKLLVGGNFSELNGVRLSSFARLLNDPATQALTVPTGERVQWLRGGSSPELQRVWFDLSINNGTSWTPLAPGAPIPGGWEATGLSLAGEGLVRARGYAPAGRFNGSSSVMETQVPFSFSLPAATTLGAAAITGVSAILNGGVNANGTATTVIFEYGLADTYGEAVTASPAMLGGNAPTAVEASLTGLHPETTYHYRVNATNPSGTTVGADMTFTTLSNNAKLAGLALSDGSLVPGFDALTASYIATVPHATIGITVTPTTAHARATVTVDGVSVPSGSASGVINLAVGNNTVGTVVTAEDGVTTETHTITITRLPLEFAFSSAADVPVSAARFATGGHPTNPVLNYPPVPGTTLTMVDNTGLEFIHGSFSNLAQGQRVTLGHGGESYDFVVNYFGGSGNDLVLQWADTRVLAWGGNNFGQLGDASSIQRLVPTAIGDSDLLAGKTIVAVAEGYLHSLALCADGTLAAWGYNVCGQLGDGSVTSSKVPVPVDQSGVLLGKTVIAISSGPFHNLALCADGTLVAWGYNNHGQLGSGDTAASGVPVLVNQVGALAGKQVVAIAAGSYFSFALCSDGTVAAWGYNDEGELGDGSTASSLVPVAVDHSGVLAGRRVASLSAGLYHTLALCTDGVPVAWGYNHKGQLGINSVVASPSPVEVSTSGVLAGKSVVSVRAGGAHSLALCSDGTVASWGDNNHSQLGREGISQSSLPIEVTLPEELAGGTVSAISVGRNHCMVRFADGSLAAWGDNGSGQLGNNSTTANAVPMLVDTGLCDPEMRFMTAASGSGPHHNIVVAGIPSPPAEGTAARFQGHGTGFLGDELGDSDHDGISNLLEYAFGLDPMGNSAGRLPHGRIMDGDFVIGFNEPEGVSGLVYGAEWSATMEAGSWSDIADGGTGGEHVFRVPLGTAPRLFVRLRVNVR